MLSASLLFLAACTPSPTDEAAPPRATLPPASALETPTSFVEIPLVLPLDALAADISRTMPALLVEETEQLGRGATMEMAVRRAGDVALRARSDGRLGLKIPLLLDATVTAQPPAPERGPLAKAAQRLPAPPALSADIDAGMLLDVALDIEIGADWAMHPEAAVSVGWTQQPVVRLGRLSFDVTERVEAELAKKLPEISAAIEQKVAEKDDIKEKITDAWRKLSAPQALPDAPSSWIAITPEALFVTSPRASGTGLHLTAGLIGQLQTGLGAPPAAEAAPLPPNRPPPAEADGLNLQVSVQLPWEALSAQATEAARAQRWPIEIAGAEAGELTVTRAQVYPSGAAIAVGLEYAATSALWDTTGTLWLTGRPQLDAAARTVRIEDFDYTFASWGLDAAGVNSDRLRAAVTENLSEWLTLSYGPEADAALLAANQQLSAVQTEAGTLSASLTELAPAGLHLSDEALVIHAVIQGAASMHLKPG